MIFATEEFVELVISPVFLGRIGIFGVDAGVVVLPTGFTGSIGNFGLGVGATLAVGFTGGVGNLAVDVAEGVVEAVVVVSTGFPGLFGDIGIRPFEVSQGGLWNASEFL